MKLLYVAGPYHAKDPWEKVQNVRRAEGMANLILRTTSAYPVTPHLCTPPHFEHLHDAQWWYQATLTLMGRMDGVALMPGWEASKGAREEVAMARLKAMPVYDLSTSTGVLDMVTGSAEDREGADRARREDPR